MLNQWVRFATTGIFLCQLLVVSHEARASTYDDLKTDDAFTRIFQRGNIDLSFRLRYEDVNAIAKKNASALTLRSRLLVESGEHNALQLTVEVDNVSVVSSENFSDGTRNINTAVIADPDTTEVNQAYLRFTGIPKTIIQVGRQRIALGNERFIGSVDFRQHEQTFDAATLLWKPNSQSSFYYAYLDQVHGVLGHKNPQAEPTLDGHLLDFQYEFSAAINGAVFHYDIHNKDQPFNSHKTTGVSLTARHKIADFSLATNLGYAQQQASDNNVLGYKAHYQQLEFSLGYNRYQLITGRELLGEDNGSSFQTPLGTLHKFQGFTDQFLTTPATGLKDQYATFRVLLGPGRMELSSHRFKSDSGRNKFGKEYAFGAWYQIDEQISLMFKYAEFNDQGLGTKDVRKYWLQVAYKL